MTQLYFQFANQQDAAVPAHNLIIGSFNKLAYDTLLNLFTNHHNVVYLYGDMKVGKTAVVMKSLRQNNAIELKQDDYVNTVLLQKYMEETHSYAILIDNLIPLVQEEEKNLFNLYNFVNSYNYKLIITSRYSVNNLNLTLPDLSSRLLSSLLIKIEHPSDDDLRKIFFELLQKKQIIINLKVVNYIFNNINRNIASLINVICKMENYINLHKKPVNLHNIKMILETI